MKTFNEIVANTENKDADFTVALSIDDRKMSRIITRTEDGCEVAISVDRGLVLKDGQFIKNEDFYNERNVLIYPCESEEIVSFLKTDYDCLSSGCLLSLEQWLEKLGFICK